MQLGLRRRPARALTASAARATVSNSSSMKRLVMESQLRALVYYDKLGAIKYSGNFYSRSLTQLRIFPAFKDANGEPQETEDPKVRALLDRVQDPNGGRSTLFGTYGRLRMLTGEAYLTCSYDTELEGEKWEMLSVRELRINGNGTFTRLAGPGLQPVDFKSPPEDADAPTEGTMIVYRLWRPHPAFSQMADSSMLGVLDDCEELLLLQAAVRARVRSRLAGPGLLVMADSISPPPPEVVGDEDMLADPWYEDFTEALVEPIKDEGTAAAAVPFLTRVPAELVKDGFNFISFRDANEEYREVTLRDECLKRIAIGLDMPPEVLTGIAEVNHWGSWQVDEQTFKAHIQPVCQELCDDLTSAYLRPAAQQAGIANWERLVVDYDAAEIINHPDRAKDAKELYALRAIGKPALREACNFDDEDAPTEDELAEMIGVAVRDSSLAWDGIPSVKAGGIEPEPGVIENATGQESDPTGPTTGGEVEQGPPPGGAPDNQVAAAMIMGAAELALEQARARAGARIIGRGQHCRECIEEVTGISKSLVASSLGRERVAAMVTPAFSKRTAKIPTAADLIAGGTESFIDAAQRLGLTATGARAIAQRIEDHAAQTLFEADAHLPIGFPLYVRNMLSAQLAAA